MPFQLPEGGFGPLSDEALAALESEGVAAFTELGVTPQSDADTIKSATEVVAAVRKIREEKAARKERATEASALLDEMAVEEEEPEPAPVEAAVEEPVVAAVEPEKPAAKEVVRRVVATAPATHVPARPRATATLNVAADVPGFATGSQLADLAGVTQAVQSRMRGFPAGHPTQEIYNRYATAMITKGGFDGLSQDNPDFRDDQSLLDAAAREARLSGGSLVAAGGWCAPSETLYDLCSYATTDGLISIPEVQVTRGGIRYTNGPDFGAIYAGVGFLQTEAQAIAGTAKTCYDVPCPSFTEVRLDAIGICVKSGILTNAAYPELVRQVIENALIAHQHKVSNYVIAAISASLGTALAPVSQGSTLSTLDALGWVAASVRQKYRLADSSTLEVIAPHWLPLSIKGDLGRRTGREAAAVQDAEVSAWFASRGLSPQFVYGLDDLNIATALQVKPPANATVLMYPAGSFIKGTASVIQLDSVYDSVGLGTNTYTAVFAEEGILVAQRCTTGAKVTIPICDSGRSGAADLKACFGTAEA